MLPILCPLLVTAGFGEITAWNPIADAATQALHQWAHHHFE